MLSQHLQRVKKDAGSCLREIISYQMKLRFNKAKIRQRGFGAKSSPPFQ